MTSVWTNLSGGGHQVESRLGMRIGSRLCFRVDSLKEDTDRLPIHEAQPILDPQARALAAFPTAR